MAENDEREARDAKLRGGGLEAPLPDGAFGLFEPGRLPPRADLQRRRCLREAARDGAREAGAARRGLRLPDHARPRQDRRHAHRRRQRHRHGPGRADRQSRHHRPLRHPRLPRRPLRRRRGLGADRPVRRRLLLGLHRRHVGRGHVAEGRVGRGLALDLGRHRAPSRSSRRRSTPRRRAARACCSSLDGRRQGLCRAGDDRAGRRGILGACAGADPAPARRRRRRQDARRRQRAVAEAEVGGDRSRIRRVLRPCQPPVRRAGADHPLPRRGPERIFGAPLRALDEAVRPVRSGAAAAGSSSTSGASSSPTRRRSCRPGSASCAA